MKLITNNFLLKTLNSNYLIDILKYYKDNEDFHKFSMPLKKRDFFSKENFEFILNEESNLEKLGLFYRFFIYKKDGFDILGDVSIYDIKYGNISTCYIGIKIDKNNTQIGIASEVLEKVINFIKDELKLHTIRVTILPNNSTSISLFEKFGFQFDGIIRDLFKSENGWEDHFIYSLVNQND